jgi:hypothetical protein
LRLVCSALPEGDILAGKIVPIWSAQPIVSFLLAKTTLKGIEKVSFKDGAATGRGRRFGVTVGMNQFVHEFNVQWI